MDAKLLNQLNRWHDDDEYEKIINCIRLTPGYADDYQLMHHLARAYNNVDEYDCAIDTLMSIKEQGENDPLWHYKLGYALCYQDRDAEAKEVLLHAKQLAQPGEAVIGWVDELLELIEEYSGEEQEEFGKAEEEAKSPDTYDYAVTVKHEDSISVCFYCEHDKPFAIGEKMNQINEEAYMNGYNWEAFFNYYLEQYAPDVLTGMDTDPEAGMYAAYYRLTADNEQRAEKFVEIIHALVENEQELYRIVREEGDEIEWD